MKRTPIAPWALVCAMTFVTVACDRSKALPETTVAPADAGGRSAPKTESVQSTAVPVAPDATAWRVDPSSEAELAAGLQAMRPLIVGSHDAYSKIEPKLKSRLFMHPDADKSASIEFDTSSLASLTLSPIMEDFSQAKECVSSPEAGVVQITWTIDNGAPNRFMVDRKYSGNIDIDLKGGARLKIEADAGNKVPWCDWFSVGFTNVKLK